MPKDDGVHNYFFGGMPEMPWKKENNMSEEKIFKVYVGWGMGNYDDYLMKAESQEKAEEKAEKIFANSKYISVISLDELDFDEDGVCYL